MRAIWSGSISFGLVNIPVKLYSAAEDRQLHFNLFSKKDLCPIRYAKVCRRTGEEIPYEEIVRGYEYAKGDYVILSDDDFVQADLRKSKTVDILDFIEGHEINPMLFEAPYYLEPAKGAERPYALLREGLAQSGKIGIGKFILRRKEILAALASHERAIVLYRIRFQDEIRSAESLKLPSSEDMDTKEIELALRLIEQLTGPFQPEKYEDTYSKKLYALIEKKAKGETVHPDTEEELQPTPVADLMSVLRSSIEKEYARTK